MADYGIFRNQTVLIISIVVICVVVILIVLLCYFKLRRSKGLDYDFDKRPLVLSSIVSKSQSTKSFIGPKSRSYYDQFLTDDDIAHYRPKSKDKITESTDDCDTTSNSDSQQEIGDPESYDPISTLLGNSKPFQARMSMKWNFRKELNALLEQSESPEIPIDPIELDSIELNRRLIPKPDRRTEITVQTKEEHTKDDSGCETTSELRYAESGGLLDFSLVHGYLREVHIGKSFTDTIKGHQRSISHDAKS